VLIALAERLARSTLQRHLLFLAATLFAITFVGYHFGTFDQAVHIPFLKKYADPSLYPGDPFLELRHQHYSYFWFIFLPFYRLGVLEPIMFAAHVLATYLTFWALWALSDTLFGDPLAALLGLAAFAFPHVGFAGFPILEFSLLNRTFVLPFLLAAILLFLRARYLLAFLLLGVMYNLHVISVNFVLAMFLFDGLLELRRVGLRNLGLGLFLFVGAALPVLVWKLGDSSVDLGLRSEWFSTISRGTFYNLFYLFPPYLPILLSTLSGLSAFALFALARRAAPAPAPDRAVVNFMYAILIVLAVQVVTAQWLPVTIVIQSQIIRAGVFALIFGYLYFAHYLARQHRSGAVRRLDFGLLAGAFIALTLPFAALVVRGVQRLVAAPRWRTAIASLAVLVMLAGTLATAFEYRLWYPGIYVFARPTPWYDVQVWARRHTPRDALFITPPHLWWFYEPDWRVFSERSTIATHSELLEAAFAPDYLGYWEPRFEAVAPGALPRFRGNIFENLDLTARAFYDLTADDVRRMARDTGASYLVVEKPRAYPFAAVYANEQFVVYDLRPVTSH
jgi:hypothetical protein